MNGPTQVPEEKLVEAMQIYLEAYNVAPPGIKLALDKGSKFKENGLTPFYVLDPENGDILVTSEENMDRKLH